MSDGVEGGGGGGGRLLHNVIGLKAWPLISGISGAIPRRSSLPVYMPWFALSLTFVFISLPS